MQMSLQMGSWHGSRSGLGKRGYKRDSFGILMRLKLAGKTKEDRKRLLKGLGIDDHLNKGAGAVMGRSTGGGAGLQGWKKG